MNLKPFTGPGSTPSRRRFWDKVTQAVIASQKVAGKNVSVDEHQGMGSVINVPDSNRRSSGACPVTTDLVLTFAGVSISCGCQTAGTTFGSIEITGDINTDFTVPFSPESVCGRACEWILTGQEGYVTDQPYNNTDCTDPVSVGPTSIALLVTLESGTFRVLVLSDGGLFYGSGAYTGSFPVVITNTLSCAPDAQSVEMGTDCTQPLITFAGTGGTCTITQP